MHRVAVIALALFVLPAPARAQDEEELPTHRVEPIRGVLPTGVPSIRLDDSGEPIWPAAPARDVYEDFLDAQGLAGDPPDRAMDVDGATLRNALREGRALARADRCDEAIPLFTRASESSHDDGRAALELASCARRVGALDVATDAARIAMLRAGVRARSRRAQVLYELGRIAEAQGEPREALDRYLDSLTLRPSETVSASARRVAHQTTLGLESARAYSLLPAPGAPCEGLDEEHCEASFASGGADYAIVRVVEGDGWESEVVTWLYARHDGVWFSREIGRAYAGDGGMGGTGVLVDVTRFDEVDAVRGGRREVLLETRVIDVDHDWCEAYWEVEDREIVCGAEQNRVVCWADLPALHASFVTPGRISWLESVDPEEGTTLDEEWQACGFERSPRTPEEWSAARADGLPERHFALRFAEGVMHVSRGAPPALAAIHDVRELPCLVGATGFDCNGQ